MSKKKIILDYSTDTMPKSKTNELAKLINSPYKNKEVKYTRSKPTWLDKA